MEKLMRAGGPEDQVRASLSKLAADYPIHRHEFAYWANLDDDYYTTHPEDGWSIMVIVREIMSKTEQGANGIES